MIKKTWMAGTSPAMTEEDQKGLLMFTGIVTDIGEIISLTPTAQGQLHRLRIACRYDRATIADGASRVTRPGSMSMPPPRRSA